MRLRYSRVMQQSTNLHNYIREHQGLKEKDTPAEKCGIDIEGKNKWLMLIQNASNSN